MTDDTTSDTTDSATGTTEAGESAVVIERVFDAPSATVWRMWTEPEHFAAWYGPQGATIPESTLDARVGGVRRVCMQMDTPNGPHRMWFAGEHLEVVEGRRLVYTEAMTDADGNVLSPADLGMPGDHPSLTQVIVELEPLGQTTRMVMTHVGVPADSPGAIGWGMAFDKLAAYLGAS